MIINNYEGKLSLVQKSIHLFSGDVEMVGGGRDCVFFYVGCLLESFLDANQNTFIHS